MTTALRYLGLDLAKATGWCLVEGDQVIGSGVRAFSTRSSDLHGTIGMRFYNFLVGIGHVDEIYYEKIQFGGGFMNKKTGKMVHKSGDHHQLYHGLLMVLSMYAAGFGGIPCIGIHPGTLKVAFAGHGRAEKEDMCRAARELGWQGGTEGTDRCHDEADAIALVATQLRERQGVTIRF